MMSKFCSISSIFLLVTLFSLANSFRLPNRSNGTDNQNLGIVDGSRVSSIYYQMHALIGLENGDLCSGVILNSRHILTAAFCLYNDDGEIDIDGINIFVGIDRMSETKYDSIRYYADDVKVNPDYEGGYSDHGSAIITTDRDISFWSGKSHGAQPACIDYSGIKYKYYSIVGFGATQGKITRNGEVLRESTPSDDLVVGYVKDKPDMGCNENNICVQNYYDDRSTAICYEDFGGPLVTPKKNVIGIAIDHSRHKVDDAVVTCKFFSKFINLKGEMNFIDEVVGADQYCAYV